MLSYIQAECRRGRANLILAPVKKIYIGGSPALGSYDRTSKTLSVAVRHADWPETLAHEFAHFQQDQEFEQDHWASFDEAAKLFDSLMTGEKFDQSAIDAAIRTICAIEADAESRALDMLTSYGIIEGPEYIKEANAYMFMHVYSANRGSWPDTGPSNRGRRPDGIFPEVIVADPVSHYNDAIKAYFDSIVKV